MAFLVKALIRAYQIVLSPIFGGACRYTPTCSTYAITAIEKHGAARGSWLAIKRIGRCHPFGAAGYDPVPDSTSVENPRGLRPRAQHGDTRHVH